MAAPGSVTLLRDCSVGLPRGSTTAPCRVSASGPGVCGVAGSLRSVRRGPVRLASVSRLGPASLPCEALPPRWRCSDALGALLLLEPAPSIGPHNWGLVGHPRPASAPAQVLLRPGPLQFRWRTAGGLSSAPREGSLKRSKALEKTVGPGGGSLLLGCVGGQPQVVARIWEVWRAVSLLFRYSFYRRAWVPDTLCS